MLIHWIWLSTRPAMGDRVRMALLQHFQDAEDIYYADAQTLSELELSPEAVQALQDRALDPAREILNECDRKGIHIVTFRDAAYPNRLRSIADPPVVLYYKGTLPLLDELPTVAVVGTRKATAYGLTTAKRMGYQIAACGGVVVSGMAYGVDGMATAGALTAGMPVVGVLGCGADVIYPMSNKSLFLDTERAGCLLTEFPPGTPPSSWNFPRRNRIISGLSCGVLVVEAPEKSGALITARQAADQGRDVFVVPGNIDVETCRGSNALLRDGAIAVSSGWDVLSEYAQLYPGKVRRCTAQGHQSAYPDEVAQQNAESDKDGLKVAQKPTLPGKNRKEKPSGKKKEIDNGETSPYIEPVKPLPALTESEQKLLDQLRLGQDLVDDLIAETALPAGTVLAALTMLEIKGIVKHLPGKRVQLQV